MYGDIAKITARRIKKLVSRKYIQSKSNVYLFGVSDNTREIAVMLRKNGIEPAGIIENDVTKYHNYCSRILVIPLEEIEDATNENNIYIVFSYFWREMVRQLLAVGICERQIKNLYLIHDWVWMKGFFTFGIYNCLRGKKLYQTLKKKYGDEHTIFLCPYTGTGDIYLIGTMFFEYMKRQKIEKYTFVVVSNACKKVAQIFDIENIEVLTDKRACGYLLTYYRSFPDNCKLKVLNDGWGEIYTSTTQWFRGYKGLNFTDMFRNFVFELENGFRPEKPILKNHDAELDILFQKYQLVQSKTVVLSPYANTLAEFSEEFWEKIVQSLIEKGFCVCTNSSGESEPAISGTQPIFFPLNIAIQFIEKAGCFIGVRSGLCDVISSAAATKIILYDKYNRFYNSSAFEYFSLREMELSEDVVEVQYIQHEEDACITRILECVKEGERGYAI